ncbi:MAG: ABC transporter ATP-binding protein [Eubacteriales bacterium]|nr:ABC transporter ATP-binding protein [Eubacteriales bacterium]
MRTVNETNDSIEIRELIKSYGNIKAVDGLTLNIAKGQIFGFLGPNGAGKTTTMRMIAGLTKPDSGDIYLAGRRVVFGGKSGREKLGFLPDVPECYGYMNVREFLEMCAMLQGYTRAEARVRADEMIELTGLTGVNKRIGAYSRGMKQRAGIAQALIHDPDIVLMDEPVSALDPEGRYDVIEILKKLKGNKTVFISSHIISDVEKICDSVAVINKGKLIESGPVSAIKDKYDNRTIIFGLPVWTVREKIGRFEAMLRNSDWCEDVSVDQTNHYRIKVTNRSTAQLALPGIFASNEIPVEYIDSVTTSLEDIFLEVIRK